MFYVPQLIRNVGTFLLLTVRKLFIKRTTECIRNLALFRTTFLRFVDRQLHFSVKLDIYQLTSYLVRTQKVDINIKNPMGPQYE